MIKKASLVVGAVSLALIAGLLGKAEWDRHRIAQEAERQASIASAQAMCLESPEGMSDASLKLKRIACGIAKDRIMGRTP